jgi:DNA segregation ATPase FtsK/SpoIIIE, S-DNA-T family
VRFVLNLLSLRKVVHCKAHEQITMLDTAICSIKTTVFKLTEYNFNASTYIPAPTLEAQIKARFAQARDVLPSAFALLTLLLVAVALFSFHPADAGWSTTGKTGGFYNWLSAPGAWVADVLLYAVGRSVWIVVLIAMLWSIKALVMRGQGHRTPSWVWLSIGCLVLWMLMSSGLEALRFNQTRVALPYGAGGVIGYHLGKLAQGIMPERWAVMALAMSWFLLAAATLGTSWLAIASRVGSLWDSFQSKQAAKQDVQESQAMGQVLEAQREAELAQFDTHYEPLPIEVRSAAPVVIPKYAPQPIVSRAEQERRAKAALQPALFESEPEPDADEPSEQILRSGNDQLPPLDLLDPPDVVTEFISRDTLEYTSRLIEKKLRDYNVTVKVVAAQPGPVITRYEIEPAEGVKGSQIVNLSRDLARSLSLTSIRVVETIPGKDTMGLELPNPKRQTVRLSEILGSGEYVTSKAPLTMALGKDITGEPVVMDLAKMPHLLVAGTTGSGKSVGINAMILSLLYKTSAEQVRLILIDPKMLELSVYEGIPQLLAPVVTDMKQAAHAVNWCVMEMERRYKLMSKLGVRGLAGYNEKIAKARDKGEFIFNPFSLTPEDPEPLKPFTHIVLVVDELADLLMVVGKKIEEPLARLAQKSRACGIHLILATQRPSADVLTGLIRSNVPARIAFQVSSKTDSRIILDQMGADALLGNGDMLYLPKGSIPIRVHGAFVSDEEVVRVATMLRELGEPDYVEGMLDGPGGDDEETLGNETGDNDAEKDPLYDKAVEVVISTKKASISNVQRQLRVGYQRAARMIDAMERAGLVSAAEHNGNRSVLARQQRDFDL